jgi:hypothetical protein
MYELAGMHIEKRAVMELIYYLEEQMDLVIIESKKQLDKRNEYCEVQKIRPKQRIDCECVRQAIKIINNNCDSSLPKRAGGKFQKTESKKHSQENTEVV